jgi:hypothetical protein
LLVIDGVDLVNLRFFAEDLPESLANHRREKSFALFCDHDMITQREKIDVTRDRTVTRGDFRWNVRLLLFIALVFL